MSIFDNPTNERSLQPLNSTNYREGKGPCSRSISMRSPKTELRAVKRHCNFRVLNILPVTTLRTIDLGGKKIPGLLFSRFCAEASVFFELVKLLGLPSPSRFGNIRRFRPAPFDLLQALADSLFYAFAGGVVVGAVA